MPIKLVSLVNRPQAFNLICASTRVRRDTFEHDPNTGQQHTRRGYVTMPGSISLPARARTKLLPDAAASEAEIAGAERAGMIKIIRVTAADVAAETKAERAQRAKAEARAEKRAAKRKREAAASAADSTNTPTETPGAGA